MEKRKKWIYLLGSLAIGMIAAIAVLVILTAAGVLESSKPKLVFVSGSQTFEYDGKEHVYRSFELQEGTLKEGHSVTALFTGVLIDAGICENTFTVTIKNEQGNDVTSSYSVEYRYGNIEVKPRKISVSTASGTKIYDGLPLTCPEWEIVSETGLLDGHFVQKAVLPAERTEVGVSENYVSEIVVSDGTKDVTNNYEFIYYAGELTVTPRRLTIRSGSAAKNFDGLPLTCDTWDIVSMTKPIEGHAIEVRVSGERTEVGESENTISEVRITSGGKDVTYNYEITVQEGALVVKGSGSGGSTGGEGGEGGPSLNQDGSIGSAPVTGEAGIPLSVYSEREEKIYLRLMSFGDYNGTGWDHAEDCNMLLPGGYGMNYLTGIALQNAGYMSTSLRIRSEGGDYVLPYYLDTFDSDYDVQAGDVAYAGDTSFVYRMYYYSYDVLSDGVIVSDLGSYTAHEAQYRQYVREHYLAVPATSRAFLDSLIKEQGFVGDVNTLIAQVADFVAGAALYDLDYDKALDAESDIVVSFLRDYKTGICQHFASAAVLLYRALGIPARYTIGYASDVSSYLWTDITADKAHAWVEVYVDGVGWVQVEVTAGAQDKTEDGSEAEFIVRPVTEYMKYDGVNTLYPSGKLQGISDLTERGFRYEVKISGCRRDVGVSPSRIESFRLFNSRGEDVTDTYTFRFETGKLQVYLQEITIVTGGAQKVYDGTPLINEQCVLDGKLLFNHRIETLSAKGSRVNVGKSLNVFVVKIVDETGKDVTDYYKINASYGDLEVFAREIVVTAASAEKVYDGTPLTMNLYEIFSDSGEPLAQGHTALVTVFGTQTEIGRSDNVIAEIKIFDETGEDVTENYTMVLVNGVLTVKPY